MGGGKAFWRAWSAKNSATVGVTSRGRRFRPTLSRSRRKLFAVVPYSDNSSGEAAPAVANCASIRSSSTANVAARRAIDRSASLVSLSPPRSLIAASYTSRNLRAHVLRPSVFASSAFPLAIRLRCRGERGLGMARSRNEMTDQSVNIVCRQDCQ
jgi:hypothetical protein